MYKENRLEIELLITSYFKGVYNGEVDKLEKCFHNNLYLYGDIKGEDYLKSKYEYIEGVKSRKSPSNLKEKFNMNIIGLDILGKVAMAKVHLPFSGYNYYDYLSMAKINGKWIIVNKIFTHVE
ncbi:nuclear transport factor 2 family protein [Flagellimonas pacifica]|uniref:Putative lumazine-binding n=1 Tax=Flagellimonas pacifica TaxID=1247520 RepID=A0A285MF71_9FLAO|nr:nuclear transport factor 2 family protein [Allomuricauda parva]SNY95117.1 Putative lumazine-binding [Allomuricauda parva]